MPKGHEVTDCNGKREYTEVRQSAFGYLPIWLINKNIINAAGNNPSRQRRICSLQSLYRKIITADNISEAPVQSRRIKLQSVFKDMFVSTPFIITFPVARGT
jgi:hypothetical protein